MPPDISVVIVTWNGRPYLQDCLRAIAAQEGVSAETVLVDNASTDGTAEYVREAIDLFLDSSPQGRKPSLKPVLTTVLEV